VGCFEYIQTFLITVITVVVGCVAIFVDYLQKYIRISLTSNIVRV